MNPGEATSMNRGTGPVTELCTVGHGTLTQGAFVDLLLAAGLYDLVDIRSFPGSRRNPQFARESMERWVPDVGVAYTWMRDLGGRRKPVPGSPHVALRHPSRRSRSACNCYANCVT